MLPPRIVTLVAALVALHPSGGVLRADATTAAPAVLMPKLTAEQVKFAAARNGTEVLLSWEFPSGYDVRRTELFRHFKNDAPGRKRIGSVSIGKGSHADQTPDAGQAYWYWMKVMLESGQTLHIGPIATPAPDVWQP